MDIKSKWIGIGYALGYNDGYKKGYNNGYTQGAEDGGTNPSTTIASLENPPEQTAYVGDTVAMPSTVVAHYADGHTASVAVTWNPSSISTSTVGTYRSVGTVSGYSGNCTLTVNIQLKVGAVNFNGHLCSQQPPTGSLLSFLNNYKDKKYKCWVIQTSGEVPGGVMHVFVSDTPCTANMIASYTIAIVFNASIDSVNLISGYCSSGNTMTFSSSPTIIGKGDNSVISSQGTIIISDSGVAIFN